MFDPAGMGRDVKPVLQEHGYRKETPMTEDTSARAMVQKHKKELIADSEKNQRVNDALVTLIEQVELLTSVVEPYRADDIWHQTQGIVEHVRNSR